VYHEEDIDEDDEIYLLLFDDYVLLELEQRAPIVSDCEELVKIPVTILSNSSSPPLSSLVEIRGAEGKIPTSFTDSTTLDVSSLPPPQVPVAAWWDGWKSPTTSY